MSHYHKRGQTAFGQRGKPSVHRLLLASQSLARQRILAGAGVPFTAIAAPIDERAEEAAARRQGKDLAGIAQHLAAVKALAVSTGEPGSLVIGADQVLALKSELLHKPADLDAARGQLDKLCGDLHHLHAAVALARDGAVLWSHVETAALRMRAFSAEERDKVLEEEGDAVLASVGGYRLEGPSVRLFSSIEGDFFAMLGLPLLPLLGALRRLAPELVP